MLHTRITCPCGEFIEGETEDDLVEKTQAHLQDTHGRTYGREEILLMAY